MCRVLFMEYLAGMARGMACIFLGVTPSELAKAVSAYPERIMAALSIHASEDQHPRECSGDFECLVDCMRKHVIEFRCNRLRPDTTVASDLSLERWVVQDGLPGVIPVLVAGCD